MSPYIYMGVELIVCSLKGVKGCEGRGGERRGREEEIISNKME